MFDTLDLAIMLKSVGERTHTLQHFFDFNI